MRIASLSPSHRASRLTVVHDVARFLLQHRAAERTFAETVQAALDKARGYDDVEWFALGILTGHYRHGGTPDPNTIAEVIAHLERLAPKPVVAEADPFAGLPL